ncbi:oligoendopeptidase F [Pseudobutyrivibrio sp. 49]|uniref:oligoendopeptidase F n=1 Tax=unclassified Pseudobutyrivibrio TaxID=2638619 RepID=UPI00089274C5|nr:MULTISPECIES: oligoendopeptidase F [unclassified Pseudobutyrivibrio]SDH72809.1 oligoendopeptidase F [Pseudobutyrivibrio sp. 49]SFN75218.1 oligoendopeptidase F [Pseudobutyrivibrio sp. UC1225]
MAETLKKRSEVPVELTWDTSRLFKSSEELMSGLEDFKKLTADMVSNYKGKLTDAKAINECLDKLNQWNVMADHLYNYVELNVSVDYTNAEAQKEQAIVMSEFSKALSTVSFVDSELAEAPKELIEEAIKTATVGKHYLEDVERQRPHRLTPETEAALAALRETVQAPYTIYETSKLADIQFPDFEVNGEKHPLGYSLFEDNYEYERNTEVRRAAFDAFSKKIREYMYTTATVYGSHVRTEKTISELRRYDSVLDYLLFEQKVTREMYDRQIDLIMEKLAPHMRKYARLLKEANGLDKMTYADLKIALDPDYDPQVTIEKSKEYIIDGLSIMGPEYKEMLETAYKERWVDFAQNIGKSTGGFCASPYQKGSYILLSWNDRMSDVFTLAHELGHAGHFAACGKAQSALDVEVSNYVVEAPSTINELLMAEYLKEKSGDDKRFRRWVLSAQISNTYYHNFVTHLLEAAYQREVYKLVDKGEAVPAETLNEIYKNVLKKFWGDEVELTEGCELTWMRQPHYYMGLYSYSYSASLTIATQVMKRIRKEGQPAVEDWKKTLAAGGTVTPVEFAKMAGVDVTTDAALLDTIDYIGSIIDEIEQIGV